MITENNTVNDTEAEFDMNTFDWEKWKVDMKKAIDGINEMTEKMKSPFPTESTDMENTKEGEINGGKKRWWKKCFSRAKRNS